MFALDPGSGTQCLDIPQSGSLGFVSLLNALIQRLQNTRINGRDHIHRRV
jgi:hypothetical protein